MSVNTTVAFSVVVAPRFAGATVRQTARPGEPAPHPELELRQPTVASRVHRAKSLVRQVLKKVHAYLTAYLHAPVPSPARAPRRQYGPDAFLPGALPATVNVEIVPQDTAPTIAVTAVTRASRRRHHAPIEEPAADFPQGCAAHDPRRNEAARVVARSDDGDRADPTFHLGKSLQMWTTRADALVR